MPRGFRLTMTNDSTHAVGERLGKHMSRATCRDLDPARKVSAEREVS